MSKNVTIWDLDYYYAQDKKNIFDPDLMRISSYHKQLGDNINFVVDKYDIYRPYDIYYVCKNKKDTPNPPLDFYTNSRVRWIGKAFKSRRHWKMPDVVMAVRPDYLLYPERKTQLEKSEQIRLFNAEAQLLPRIQDYSNTFKGNKRIILTDDNIWFSNKKDLIQALKILQPIKKLSFSEPIWFQKINNDEDIKKEFFKLNLTPGAAVEWLPIKLDEFEELFNFLTKVKETWPAISVGSITIKLSVLEHWDSRDRALADFKRIKEIIIKTKKVGLQVKIMPFHQRRETPYFFLFERISDWTNGRRANLSWLEFLLGEYRMYENFNQPKLWPDTFRDLLRQTYEDHEFLLLKRKNSYYNENDVPWLLLEQEFQNGI